MEQQTAELWVKIISIVGIVLGALGVLVSLVLILGGSFLGPIIATMIPGLVSGIFATMIVVLGIVTLIICAFEIFLYISLRKLQNWARIVVIIFTGLGTLGTLFSLITSGASGIVGLIINGGIFYLLTFQKEIIALFNTQSTTK